jgi:hypothetical protein
MSDLDVEVSGNDITVAQRGTPFAVTYHKHAASPILEAREILELPEISAGQATFLAAAWQATYAQAKALGWL